MKKSEKLSYIIRRSREMAESGDHADYMSIELALRVAGYPEARDALDSKTTRNYLNELCNRARISRGLPLSPIAKSDDKIFG